MRCQVAYLVFFGEMKMYKLANLRLAIAAAALSAGTAMAQTASTPEATIGTSLTAVLAIVAVGGAAMIATSAGSVLWGVGVKFVKRLRGSA